MLKAVLFDLDGTIYHGERRIDGAEVLVSWLDAQGVAVAFLTNNSTLTAPDVVKRLSGMGIETTPRRIISSAHVAAAGLGGKVVFAVGEDGLLQALREAGTLPLESGQPDAVVVGLDRRFDYEKLRLCTTYVRCGARFIGTNPDRQINTAAGIAPGNGALLAAITASTGVAPEIAGKPEPGIVKHAMAALGATPAETLLIGDNIETDIPAGAAAGVRTLLLLTGISTRRDVRQSSIQPDIVAADHAEVRRAITAMR